jgi:uridylate kinase
MTEHLTREIVIVSVGGSLIVPDQIDTNFLSNFREYLTNHIDTNGTRFVIIAGGGKTARRYQQAADTLTDLSAEDIDWLGIHATRLNAHLLRAIFHNRADPVVIKAPDRTPVNETHDVLIASGWKPGWSTDYVAVKIAEHLGAQRMVNLSNIDYAYDKDPKQFDDAQPITDISWHEFRRLLPEEWDPGINVPFDPIASKHADELNMEVGLINGSKLNELDRFLRYQEFTGTRIHSV